MRVSETGAPQSGWATAVAQVAGNEPYRAGKTHQTINHHHLMSRHRAFMGRING